MKFRLPMFTRREFIKTTSSVGAVASVSGAAFAPSMVQTTNTAVGKKGSFKGEILCQTIPWFELKKGETASAGGETRRPVDRVIGTTSFHPHARFLPNGTALAYNNKSESGGGDIYLVEI